MDAMLERCAALAMLDGRGKTKIRIFGTMTRQIEALLDWLVAQQVTHVAISAMRSPSRRRSPLTRARTMPPESPLPASSPH